MQIQILRGRRTGTIAGYAASTIIVLAICLIHLALPFRFPVPWPDEASFIAPAFELARHGTVFVWAMNPDRPVMWMPPGYFFFLAGLFKLFGYGFGLARWASAACVIFAAFIVGRLIRRFTTGGLSVCLHALTVVAFLSPYLLISANMARMEALLALVELGALLACLAGLPVLGAAIVAASITIHFNAVYFALPCAAWFAWLLIARKPLVIRPVEYHGAAITAVILTAYVWFVRDNSIGFIYDIHFQLQLKRFFGYNDPYHPLWPLIAAGAFSGVVCLPVRKSGSKATTAIVSSVDGGTPKRIPPYEFDGRIFLALYGTSFVLMATEGREMWYDMAPPIGFLLIAIALSIGARTLSLLCLPLCAACLIATGYRPTPFLGPLLPTYAMLSHPILPRADIARMRAAIATLPAGSTVEFAWGGIQPFFFDALDRAGARWTIPQHSVTDPTLDRRPDWQVLCYSPDTPPYMAIYYPKLSQSGCQMARP